MNNRKRICHFVRISSDCILSDPGETFEFFLVREGANYLGIRDGSVAGLFRSEDCFHPVHACVKRRRYFYKIASGAVAFAFPHFKMDKGNIDLGSPEFYEHIPDFSPRREIRIPEKRKKGIVG